MLTKKMVFEALGLPFSITVVFYDASYDPDIHFTEEVLLDFWQMVSELIIRRKEVFGILKPKIGNEKYDLLSDRGQESYRCIKKKCFETGRFHFIDNPREIGITEAIAISDINICMGMCSPSTIALICGKIGLYYDTTGNKVHPFTRKIYRNKIAFTSKGALFSVVDRIIDSGYNPLNEIDKKVLRALDYGRDGKALKRLTEVLVTHLPPGF